MTDLSTPELLLLCAGAIGFGFLLLSRGGDWLIDGAVYVAARAGMSRLLIGATIVAFGTSAPEMAVSLDAAFKGFHDLSVGNVVGSNIANILFIFGVQVAIVGAVSVAPWAVRRDVVALVLASAALLAFTLTGLLPRWGGLLMIFALIGFTWWQAQRDRTQGPTSRQTHIHAHSAEVQEGQKNFPSLWHALAFIGIGLATLVLGARILVLGAVVGAKALGVSEAVIGLTIVAVGTSLPELFAGLAAARKGHGDIAIGNILGSNLFNILAILGVAAVAVPLTLSASMLSSVVLMLVVTVAFGALLWVKGEVRRPLALAAILGYAAYTGWLYLQT